MIWPARKRSRKAAAVIDVAPGIGESSLARTLADCIRRGTESNPGKRAVFEGMRGAIAVIADDAGEAFTLRFDFGRLVVHNGLIGIPDVTIRGTAESIRGLADLPYPSWLGAVSGLIGRPGLREALRREMSALRSGELKFYGVFLHARLIVSLLRVVSRTSLGLAP